MENSIAIKRKIAKVIREKRRYWEMSQEELAIAIGYSDAFVSNLEAAKSSLPAECVPLLVDKLRFKSIPEFWQKIEQMDVEFIDDGWDSDSSI